MVFTKTNPKDSYHALNFSFAIHVSFLIFISRAFSSTISIIVLPIFDCFVAHINSILNSSGKIGLYRQSTNPFKLNFSSKELILPICAFSETCKNPNRYLVGLYIPEFLAFLLFFYNSKSHPSLARYTENSFFIFNDKYFLFII